MYYVHNFDIKKNLTMFRKSLRLPLYFRSRENKKRDLKNVFIFFLHLYLRFRIKLSNGYYLLVFTIVISFYLLK